MRRQSVSEIYLVNMIIIDTVDAFKNLEHHSISVAMIVQGCYTHFRLSTLTSARMS